MKKRVISASVALPVVIGIIGAAPARGVFVFICVVQFLAALEILRLFVAAAPREGIHKSGGEFSGFDLKDCLLALASLGIFICLSLGNAHHRFALLNVCSTLVMLWAALLPGSIVDRAERVKSLLLSLIYSVLPWVALWDLYGLAPKGRYVIQLLAMSWAGDTFAFLLGKTWGKSKLAPVISPHKTWLGAISGFLATVVTGLLVTAYYQAPVLNYHAWPGAVWLGVVTALTGQAGDLFKSVFKRQRNVKDSGHIIPGHGGLLDRLDSVLLSAPVFLYCVTEFGL